MTTDELSAIVKAVMDELEKAGVDFDFKAEEPQADDLVYVMRGTADKYNGITVKWQNLLDIIVKKATDAKDEAVSAKDIALQTLATIQGIESNVSSMKSSVETTKSQVETMKASVETSESNVTQMKSEVSTMKESVEGTKTEVEGLKSDVTSLKTQTQTIVDNAKEDVEGLLDTKVDKSAALSYEEIMASTPPMDLDSAVAKASAVKDSSMVPDYSADNMITVNELTTEGGTWTAPNNGVLKIYAVKDNDGLISEITIRINNNSNNEIRYKCSAATILYCTQYIPLKKGDILQTFAFTNIYSGGVPRFFPSV